MTARRARPGVTRRKFIQQMGAATTLVAVSGCGGSAVQPKPSKVYRIGWLGAVPTPVPLEERYPMVRLALRDLGYVEGQNLVIEFRMAVGGPQRLPELANELIELQVDLLLASTSGPALAAQKATRTIPIVFHGLEDPIGLGIVPSLSRPGGNVTGVAGKGVQAEAKRLEFLKETVPSLSRIAMLHNGTDGGQRLRVQAAQSSAAALGVSRVDPIATNSPADLESALETIARHLPDGLVDANPDSMYGTSRARLGSSAILRKLLDFLIKHRLPHMCSGAAARAGGLMGYGDDTVAATRRVASVVDKILKGANPADVPVELNSEFVLVLNLGMAQRIGLTFPESVLRQATEVIQ